MTCANNGYYLAYQSDCVGLQLALSGQPYNGTVKRTERVVCYQVSGQSPHQCCIALANPIRNAVDAELLNYVITLNNQCWDGKFGVAGIITYSCNNVCLTNHDWDPCMWFVASWDAS